MQRSNPGSSLADSRPSGRWPRRLVTMCRRGLLGVCALGLTLMMVPASAQADPEPSEQDLQAKIDKLTTKAEVVTEKYNRQRLELQKAKAAARRAEQRANRLQDRFRNVGEVLAELAATRYKTGGWRRPLMLMAAEDPQQLIDRATMLTHLSRDHAARLKELQATYERAKRAERKAERSAARVRRMTEELQDKKERIEGLVAEVEAKLSELGGSGDGPAPVDVGDVGSGVAARAAEIALNQQGDPYVWGAAGPDAFDCSGLAVYAYRQVGISLPHYTGALWDSGQHVSRSQLRPGDLVFTSPHHMGIYVGDGQMVHAPNSGTVVQVDDIYSFYGAVRVS